MLGKDDPVLIVAAINASVMGLYNQRMEETLAKSLTDIAEISSDQKSRLENLIDEIIGAYSEKLEAGLESSTKRAMTVTSEEIRANYQALLETNKAHVKRISVLTIVCVACMLIGLGSVGLLVQLIA